MTVAQRLRLAEKLARHYWALACQADGIPPRSQFVTFSPGNRPAISANLASRLTLDLTRRYIAGER